MKEGIIKVVSKTGGIILEEEYGSEPNPWINPHDSAEKIKKNMVDNAEFWKGKHVQMVLLDGKYLSVIEQEIPNNESVSEKPGKANVSVEDIPDSPEKTEHNDSEIKQNPRTDVESSKDNYYSELSKVALQTEKKGKLTYASWSEAWDVLKRKHPEATYHIFQDENGMPYFKDSSGGFCKVSVTVQNLTHTIFLPIMDHMNKTVLPEKIDAFQINKTIQRALTKAIAMHGVGIWIYNGEDVPKK